MIDKRLRLCNGICQCLCPEARSIGSLTQSPYSLVVCHHQQPSIIRHFTIQPRQTLAFPPRFFICTFLYILFRVPPPSSAPFFHHIIHLIHYDQMVPAASAVASSESQTRDIVRTPRHGGQRRRQCSERPPRVRQNLQELTSCSAEERRRRNMRKLHAGRLSLRRMSSPILLLRQNGWLTIIGLPNGGAMLNMSI